MKSTLPVICLLFCAMQSKAQKIDSIYFHLYTDSLKKGVYNYINVDGKLSNGNYLPLSNKEIVFESNYGKWEGNSLIIAPSYSLDSVVVSAYLIERPALRRDITIYIKKQPDGPLPTLDAVLGSPKKNKNKK